MINRRLRILVSGLATLMVVGSGQLWAETFGIEDFLDLVRQQSKEMRAIDLELKALSNEIAGRDHELGATLSVDLERFWDKRPSLSSNRQTDGRSVDVVLSKPMPFGTTLSLSSGLETSDYASSEDEQNLINWQFSLTQSLWQNAFGRQTSLRRKRDRNEYKSRALTLLKDQQELIVEFENLFWDIAFKQQEVNIRQDNYDRSLRILEWMKQRVSRNAAEEVDLLQAEALVASRQMQLQLSHETLTSQIARLNAKMDKPLPGDLMFRGLEEDRNLDDLAVVSALAPLLPVLIESEQSVAEADYLLAKYSFESDQFNPELELGYSYGKQGLSTSFRRSRHEAFSSGSGYHQIGLIVSIPLDFSLIHKSRQAKLQASQAEKLRSERLARASGIDWEDIESTVASQRERLQTARNLAELQDRKSRAEQGRYEKGRTTAFASISFEQEAAESRLLVYELLNQLRKSESRARLFMHKKGS